MKNWCNIGEVWTSRHNSGSNILHSLKNIGFTFREAWPYKRELQYSKRGGDECMDELSSTSVSQHMTNSPNVLEMKMNSPAEYLGCASPW